MIKIFFLFQLVFKETFFNLQLILITMIFFTDIYLGVLIPIFLVSTNKVGYLTDQASLRDNPINCVQYLYLNLFGIPIYQLFAYSLYLNYFKPLLPAGIFYRPDTHNKTSAVWIQTQFKKVQMFHNFKLICLKRHDPEETPQFQKNIKRSNFF